MMYRQPGGARPLPLALQPAPKVFTAQAPKVFTTQAITKGERHCGTNFIDQTLRHNFGDGAVMAWAGPSNTEYAGCDIDVQPRLALVGGGYAGCDSKYYCCTKHGVPSTACVWPHATPVAGVVFLMRSPYAWIPIVRSNPYGAVEVDPRANFSSFLRARFPDYVNIRYGDAAKGHYMTHETPMAMWSSKVGACRQYAAQLAVAGGTAGVFVAYADLFNATALAAKLVPALTAWGFPLLTGTAHRSRRAEAAVATSRARPWPGHRLGQGEAGDDDDDDDEGVVAVDGFELPLDAEAKATDNNKMAREFTLKAWKALRDLEREPSTWMHYFCLSRWVPIGDVRPASVRLRAGQADLDFFNAAIPDADLQLFGMPRVRKLELTPEPNADAAEAVPSREPWASVDHTLLERAMRAFDGDDV